jgi:glycosyltransferase involved in cell wall biosynthesis
MRDIEKRPTQLLVLCQLFYPELISTGQTLTELCEVLVELGVDVEVVCGPETIVDRKTRLPRYLENRGIKIKRVWGTRFPKLNLFGRIINQVTYAGSTFLNLLFDRSKRPILVLTNPPFLAFSCAILRSMGIGKPYIYLIFDVYPDTAINLGLLKETSFIVQGWNKLNIFIFKQAASIIVIGRCMQEIIQRKMERFKVDYSKKIQLIHVWSDDTHIRSVLGQENPFKELWDLKNKFVIGYSGNMGRFHDMETIMEAVKELNDYKDIVFLFIGEGYKKLWMMEFAEQWQLRNCQFHQYVGRELLGFSLSSLHLGLVCLSKGQEGLSVPSKTFGLLAAGVPVIAVMSEKSEIARVILEEECGLVVEPGDKDDLRKAILSLYNNRIKLAEFSQNAINTINMKYNLRNAAKSYFELIKKINIH